MNINNDCVTSNDLPYIIIIIDNNLQEELLILPSPYPCHCHCHLCFLFKAIADWIKHAFISKFNHISANVYDDFARVLRKDVLNCHKDKVILDQTYAITKRVGLAQVMNMNYVVLYCIVLNLNN